MNSYRRNLILPFLTTRCLSLGGRSPNWSANVSSNSRNVKLPFMTTRWYASSSANVSSNHRNLILPFLTTRWLSLGELDLPVDLPIWALTVEMWICHSSPLDDMPVHLPIWALTVEISYCHSSALTVFIWG